MPAPVRGVLAVDDAEVDRRARHAAPGSRSRPRAGPARRRRPRRRGSAERALGDRTVAAGWTSTSTWLPASCVYRASACCSTPREVEHAAELRPRCGDGRADGERRVGAEPARPRRRRDGAPVGSMSILEPYVRPLRTSRETDDGAVGRRVHVGAGRRADVERGVDGPLPPAAGTSAATRRRPPIAGAGAGRDTLVRLPTDRRERERAARAAVVAERRHRRPVDRKLEVERAVARDDLGRGGPAGAAAPRSRARRQPPGGYCRRTRSRAGSRAPRARARQRRRACGVYVRAPRRGGARQRAPWSLGRHPRHRSERSAAFQPRTS